MTIETVPEFATMSLISDLLGDGSPGQAPLPGDWHMCIAKLQEIRTLEEDWEDGFRAPDPAIIDFATEFAQWWQLQGCPAPCSTLPTPDGTIAFGWQSIRDKILSQLEFTDVNSIEFFQMNQQTILKQS